MHDCEEKLTLPSRCWVRLTSLAFYPPLVTTTATGTRTQLEFPRQRAVLLLASDRECLYCKSALSAFRELTASYPAIDHWIYDSTASYSGADLTREGVEATRVLVPVSATAPWPELLRKTPSVILVGKTGRVLGLWPGELDGGRLKSVRTSLEALLK